MTLSVHSRSVPVPRYVPRGWPGPGKTGHQPGLQTECGQAGLAFSRRRSRAGVPTLCPPGTRVGPVGRCCLSPLLARGADAPLGCGGASRLEPGLPGSRARGPDSHVKRAEWALEARGQGLRSEGSPCCWVCYVFCLSVTRWEGFQALFPGPKATSLNGRAKIVSVCLLCGAHVFGGWGESGGANVGEHSQRPWSMSGSAFWLTKLTHSC